MNTQICVFGGALIDRVGTIATPFVEGQSHPGHWQETVGGVAANVARHLSHFGSVVQFASIFADDEAARHVTQCLLAEGLRLHDEPALSGAQTPSYTVIHDHSGEVIVGLADMALHEHMDEAWCERVAEFGEQAEIWVVDTNISAASIGKLCEMKGSTPLYVVAVSPAKIGSVEHLLDKIDGLICNKAEAEALIGSRQKSAALAARSLIESGLSLAIVSNGAYACALGNNRANAAQVMEQLPELAGEKSEAGQLTGVGDTFAAACIFGLASKNLNEPKLILQRANAAAALAMNEPDSCPNISWKDILEQTFKSKQI